MGENMKNRDIYQRDPSKSKLVNEGVANVNDAASTEDLAVLRYELETFVCDGQYDKGLEHILDTYLSNIDQAQQPAVWVSGFYGSGKSHLVKMLRALWVDTKFEDGATARNIADLPVSIREQLKELTTQGKRHGGLHAASGTLGAGSSVSVRLALLRIVFRSAGLPEHYPAARFVMWLRDEEILDEVRGWVEENGYDWNEELANFHVSKGLPEALVNVRSELYSSPDICLQSLNNAYPYVQDISNSEMTGAIRQALTKEGKFPLTLIVLDEVQQYIGENSKLVGDVQEVVESCCKDIGGKLLFIGTGQTAVTGTPNLKKFEGRFTVRVELSDTDVEAVIRKVILAKKPDAIGEIDKVMEKNLGEISRHLTSTEIQHRQDDVQYFAQDYPLLPVRRRFWEKTLRVLDPGGTGSQLRSQLRMVHEATQTNLESPLGNVIPADYLYFDSADRLLQSRILPRNVHEKTMSWVEGADEQRLTARACGLIFLISKLAGSNKELGLVANVDSVADLMVEDLSGGSGSIRSVLPNLLDGCELLIKVNDEYRIQTAESAAWNDEFLSKSNQLAGEAHHVDEERNTRIQKQFRETVKLALTQGESKERRELSTTFDSDLPKDKDQKVYVWIRDEWSVDADSVRVDARAAGSQSPTVFVFVPKRSADDLRRNIIEFKAASATLEKRGVPTTPEGTEARAAIETYKQTADMRINELVADAFANARVFQGGGNEIAGNNLAEMILEASRNSLQRLYPQFRIADHSGWDKVYSRAQKGSPDALKAVDYEGEPANNAVCKEIFGTIEGGKKGSEIREHFEAPPFGWPGDAVDGGLQVLLVAELVRANDEHGQSIAPKELERKKMGKAVFKVEVVVIPPAHRVKVRGVFQQVDVQAKTGEELVVVPKFLERMSLLANSAGGDAPKPEKPDTSILEDIRLTAGNEQLVSIYNKREDLLGLIGEWKDLSKRIEERWSSWEKLLALLDLAGGLEAAKEINQQVLAIEQLRLLLVDPDPTKPLLKALEDASRKELVNLQKRYYEELARQKGQLEANASWGELTDDERKQIFQECGIVELPQMAVGTYEELVEVLARYPISTWGDRINALSNTFSQARKLAAMRKLSVISPKPGIQIQTIDIPRRTLETEEDIEAWVKDVREKLADALKKGPIVIN
jgi:hypothetical protein